MCHSMISLHSNRNTVKIVRAEVRLLREGNPGTLWMGVHICIAIRKGSTEIPQQQQQQEGLPQIPANGISVPLPHCSSTHIR